MMVVEVKGIKPSLNKELHRHDTLISLHKDDIDTAQHAIELFISHHFVPRMCLIDKLFKVLFNGIDYTGSFYQNLRIYDATEFDINLLLKVPYMEVHQERTSHFSVPDGFAVCSTTTQYGDMNKELIKYCKSDKQLGWILKPKKILSWFESVVSKTKNYFSKNPIIIKGKQIKITNCIRNGPAIKLSLEQNPSWLFEIDLVPALVHKTTLLVAKPRRKISHVWRLSFPYKEKFILQNEEYAKEVIRLLKCMLQSNSELQSVLCSYHLNTVVMLELRKENNWPQSKIGFYFIKSLCSLEGYLTNSFLPFVFNRNFGLFDGKKKKCIVV